MKTVGRIKKILVESGFKPVDRREYNPGDYWYNDPDAIVLKTKNGRYVRLEVTTGGRLNGRGEPYTPDPDGGFNPLSLAAIV